MKIVVGEINSRVYSKDFRILAIVKKACSARPPGFQFMPKYKNSTWDGFISLMESTTSFPTGLLGLVVEALKAKNHKVEIDWGVYSNEPELYVGPTMLHGITLRDYQIEAIEKLLEAQRGVAKMATNSGKTEVFAAILKALGDKKALIVVHRKELLHQTVDRLSKRLGRTIGKVGDGYVESGDGITVAMIQTLSGILNAPRTEFFHHFDTNEVVIVDECHHVSANQMMDALHKIPGKYRYGFSGTPLKNDVLADLKLMSVTGRVIVDVSNMDLIEQGFSAVPIIYMHDIISDKDDEWDLDYHSAYSQYIVNNSQRNDLIVDLAGKAAQAGEVVLVLVTHIEHGELLARKSGGIFSSGEHTTKHRMNVLDDMRKGIFGVYIASTIFDEGVDVPAINTLILAGGGKSGLKLLQRLGRGLRYKPGENVLKVHDFIDETNKYLMKHSEDRIDVYVEEGFRIEAAVGKVL